MARRRVRRTLDEQVVARVPWLFRIGTWLVLALPRESHVRRALFSHFTVRTMHCFTRCDAELLLTRCSPRCDIQILERPGDLDIEPTYAGHDGVRRLLNRVHQSWPGARWVPAERIELPDGRFLHLSTIVLDDGRTVPFAQRLEFRRGQMVRELVWFGTHPDALAATGIE